jgi:L-rhamnose mutarotase
MQRHGAVIGVKLDRLEEYKRYHAEVWPEVLDMIHQCNIRNYSIFYKDGQLFSYFEYIGVALRNLNKARLSENFSMTPLSTPGPPEKGCHQSKKEDPNQRIHAKNPKADLPPVQSDLASFHS